MEFSSEMTVKLLEYAGSDKGVCNDARISTDTADYSVPYEILSGRDEGLINYLMKNRHGTPFSGNYFKFYVEAPIFVFREFQRHRIGWNYNEQSGRYSELEPKFYVPNEDRPLIQTGKVGHYQFESGTEEQYKQLSWRMRAVYRFIWFTYKFLLKIGIAKEVARMILPVGIYSKMVASCNARSLMHFLSLRTIDEASKFPSYPQYEIEVVADMMEALWKEKMPITWAAFVNNGRVSP